jgi:hypothetical protein
MACYGDKIKKPIDIIVLTEENNKNEGNLLNDLSSYNRQLLLSASFQAYHFIFQAVL